VVRREDLLGRFLFLVPTVLVGAVNMMALGESGLIPSVLSISSMVGEDGSFLDWEEGGESYVGPALESSGEAELITALRVGLSCKGSVTPAPDIMSSLAEWAMSFNTMVVLARSESSDISFGEFLVLASSLLGELVARLLAILTGVFNVDLEDVKSALRS